MPLQRPKLQAWFERPLACLPRPAALLLIAVLIGACLWSIPTTVALVDAGNRQMMAGEQERKAGTKGDLNLYRAINARMAQGEGYYTAAVSLQQIRNYPTKPFFCVRSPVLAEGVRLFGESGWRVLTITMLALSLIGLFGALARRTTWPERLLAGLMLCLCGASAFLPTVGLIHELVAGLFLSAALLLYRQDRWWPSLLLATVALAVRELALPFFLLWLVFAALERRRNECLAVAAVLVLFAIGVALHAQAVMALRLPDALVSQGWSGLVGPQAFLGAITRLTPLSTIPLGLAPPLALLPLLGWFALGGRLGWFATLWFGGFALAMALFARPENYYWAMMVLPAYMIGLAFIPRACVTLANTVRGRGHTNALASAA